MGLKCITICGRSTCQLPRKQKQVAIERNLNMSPARTAVPSHGSRVNTDIFCSSSAAEGGPAIGFAADPSAADSDALAPV